MPKALDLYLNKFIPSASAAISLSLIAANALPVFDLTRFFTPRPKNIAVNNAKK